MPRAVPSPSSLSSGHKVFLCEHECVYMSVRERVCVYGHASVE